jgi:hypothetical protein
MKGNTDLSDWPLAVAIGCGTTFADIEGNEFDPIPG